MPDRYLYQKKAFLESQLIAHEMVLSELYERKARALQANQLDSCFPLALAITGQIRSGHLANAAIKAQYEQVLRALRK